MKFKLNCRIKEIEKVENPKVFLVKVQENHTVELVCTAPSSLYDLILNNKGKMAELTITPKSIITRVSATHTKHRNQFFVLEVKPLEWDNNFPSLDW